MFRNYLKITLRNLTKHKGYTFINITGLAVGICCCLLIFLYVFDELNYDRFHEHYDELYRVVLKGRFANEDLEIATSPAPMAFTLTAELPEVAQAMRIDDTRTFQISRDDCKFSESGVLFVDSTFFDVLSFPLLAGDPRTALVEPHTLVLTEDMAKKYFGNEDPIGQFLTMEDGTQYKITGIAANVPHNSHIQFDFLLSFVSTERSRGEFWISNSFLTYIRLKPGADISEVGEKLNAIVRKYAGPQFVAAMGISYEEFEKTGNSYGFYLEPMQDIYLRSAVGNDLGAVGNIQYIYIFSIIAIFILVIACINFMNLSTAKSANRAKEVGIRKAMGSFRRHLISQFLTESISLVFISIIIALILVKLALPFFNNLAGKELTIAYFTVRNWYIIPLLVLMALVVGIIAGSYPAFYLSAFQPVKVLKGDLVRGSTGGKLRSGLVVLQFAISIALIIGTFVVRQQLHYFQNKDMGYNKEQLMIVPRSDVIGDNYRALKQELKQNPNVLGATFSSGIPGNPHTINAHTLESKPTEFGITLISISADRDFAETYQLQTVQGRLFSPEISTDTSACLINKHAAALLDFEIGSGNRLIEIGRTVDEANFSEIIGIVKDFHMLSLHEPMRGIVVYNRPAAYNYLAIRLNTDNIRETVEFVENTWKKFAPDKGFEHYFFDEHFNEYYKAEMQTGQVFSIFAGLAILIACLGLFGLASFMAERKTKEIGIRKTLGASVSGITIVLVQEFTKWVIIANIVAWPAAYFLMRGWLQDFAYRISLEWWVFLLSSLIALTIAILTVSFHAVKAALSDPVKSLRYE